MRTVVRMLVLLVLAGAACDRRPPQYVTIEFTAPGNSALDFTGRFGKHDQWEETVGTTPKEFEFDLNRWPACYCLHRLGVRKTSAGADTLRIRTFCQGTLVSDTFTTTQDSLDYYPASP